MNRKSLIKNLGVTLGAAIIAPETIAKISDDTFSHVIPANPNYKPIPKAVTAINLRAGIVVMYISSMVH
ncbi:hypothetical protein EZ428_16410 [Pedobacter frigiditerrae]|uniref:Uncharacterized protein n=1 Tax=Pedobacter frigiditerrae TaxID=2530452 RepID=A0A4R0MRQ2_9SPHI|nr:hypothetical protein [Pedobacter frigiditerrae]TCC89277.1 hypothetical protein EZ428_16410 [Pedobacter frigiditerrae]